MFTSSPSPNYNDVELTWALPSEIQNLIGVVGAVLYTHPEITEALRRAQFKPLTDQQALQVAQQAALMLCFIELPDDWTEPLDEEELWARPGRTCRICGCTTERACPNRCHWVAPDLCSNCLGATQ